MHHEDICKHFILRYKEVFSCTASTVTTLYNVQMLTDKETLAELDNNIADNICWLICQELNQPVAEVATTRLKLLFFWIEHQDQTAREVSMTTKPIVRTTLVMINLLRE
jgi:hypothetical protein